jgi:hypothetical protein
MNSKYKTADIELTLGISGHLWVNESHELLDAIDQVFEKIQRVYAYDCLKVLSPLAEGADRIVARRALSLPDTMLVAILPFPMKEYLEDFSSAESVQEFRELLHRADYVVELAGRKDREEAYIALGRKLLDQSDILIAIWDGNPANGRGGTAEIVQAARGRGMPLAWITPGMLEERIRDLISSDEAQANVIFECFPSHKSRSESEN